MATDYPVRVLLYRLQQAVYELAAAVAASSNEAANTFVTVTDVSTMLSDGRLPKFCFCLNYAGSDGYQSLWIKTTAGPDNSFDVRQSSADTTVFYQRIYVKEP